MKRGTPEHPKVYELCELLGCERPTVLGYLELLWHFTAKYARQGDSLSPPKNPQDTKSAKVSR